MLNNLLKSLKCGFLGESQTNSNTMRKLSIPPYKINCCFEVYIFFSWITLVEKVQKQLKNYRALIDSFVVHPLLPTPLVPPSLAGCIQSFAMRRLSFHEAPYDADRWWREVRRAWILVALQIRPSVSTSAFHLEPRLGGEITQAISTHSQPHWSFHLHTLYRWRD